MNVVSLQDLVDLYLRRLDREVLIDGRMRAHLAGEPQPDADRIRLAVTPPRVTPLPQVTRDVAAYRFTWQATLTPPETRGAPPATP